MPDTTLTSAELTRPIIGIENRTPQEVFDIMCDRVRRSLARAGLEAGKAEESMRERAATCGADTLNAWAADLYATFEGYVEAKTTGLHAGRRIDAGNADMYAKQFRERAEAVAGSADYVATAIRALPLTGVDK